MYILVSTRERVHISRTGKGKKKAVPGSIWEGRFPPHDFERNLMNNDHLDKNIHKPTAKLNVPL